MQDLCDDIKPHANKHQLCPNEFEKHMSIAVITLQSDALPRETRLVDSLPRET